MNHHENATAPIAFASNRRCLRARPEAVSLRSSGALTLIAGLFGAPAHGQTPPIATALDAAVQEWMGQFDLRAPSFAAMQDGVLVKSAGYGGMDAGKPARLASLSKAITGVCVARLIDEGKLSFVRRSGGSWRRRSRSLVSRPMPASRPSRSSSC